MTKYHHIVLFKLHENATEQDRAKALNLLQDLGEGHAALELWKVHASIDTRKGHIIVEEAIFDTEESYQTFRTSPKHVAVGDFMKAIADWWVGDYEEQF